MSHNSHSGKLHDQSADVQHESYNLFKMETSNTVNFITVRKSAVKSQGWVPT